MERTNGHSTWTPSDVDRLEQVLCAAALTTGLKISQSRWNSFLKAAVVEARKRLPGFATAGRPKGTT